MAWCKFGWKPKTFDKNNFDVFDPGLKTFDVCQFEMVLIPAYHCTNVSQKVVSSRILSKGFVKSIHV